MGGEGVVCSKIHMETQKAPNSRINPGPKKKKKKDADYVVSIPE